MLLSHILLPTLSLLITQVISDLDDFPCPSVLPIHPNTVPSSETTCHKTEQLLESRKRTKRQAGGARLGGCGNELLSQIMQNVLGPLLSRNELKLGDTAQILQQSVQQVTGQSHEILIGKGDMVMASHQMSENSHCRLRIGEYYTTVYATPVLYVISDMQKEQELSNIDFGERLGGSGYPGQVPFPHVDPITAGIINFNAFAAAAAEGDLLAAAAAANSCFSGELIVETIEGPKRMDQLKTGDEVLSIDESAISFSPIIMFLHRDEEMKAEFNVITTAKGNSVKLTNEHLIYVSDCRPTTPLRIVRAKEVTTDHCLMGAAGYPERTLTANRITNVTKTFERGIYSPLTSTGDIIVNDVLSSCHSNLAAKTLQQSFFSIYRSLSFILPEEGPLPLGVELFSSALDIFIPTKAVFA